MRFILVLLTAFICLADHAYADGATAFETTARNAILIDFKSGHVFFEKDPNTPDRKSTRLNSSHRH